MEIGILLERRADGGNELMFRLANVESAEINAMLGFGDFILEVVSVEINRFSSCSFSREAEDNSEAVICEERK